MLVLSDRRTGETLATMDCRTLTAYRTAATSAIAAKYCAPDAREFAIIGCGIQGRYHVEAYEAICRNHMSLGISLYDHDERAQKSFLIGLAEKIFANLGAGINLLKTPFSTLMSLPPLPQPLKLISMFLIFQIVVILMQLVLTLLVSES